MADRTVEVGGHPPGRWKLLVSGFIGVFLLFQVIAPLRYYLGADPYDERFSWRMFSAVRVVRCSSQVTEQVNDTGAPRPLNLMTTIHEAWVNNLRRNRASVIRTFLALRCAEEDVREVTFTNMCVSADRMRLPDITWTRNCESGEVVEPDNPYPQVPDTAEDNEPPGPTATGGRR